MKISSIQKEIIENNEKRFSASGYLKSVGKTKKIRWDRETYFRAKWWTIDIRESDAPKYLPAVFSKKDILESIRQINGDRFFWFHIDIVGE